MTPQQELRAHTPTGPEIIAGVTLKDAKRASKWPAYCDVTQSVTGLILGLFLFCHMAFTSSMQIGKDTFWNLIQISGGTPIFGHEQLWLHVLFIGFIMLCVILHALCALRRFPTSYKQCRDVNAHITMLHHSDSSLWRIQIITGVAFDRLGLPALDEHDLPSLGLRSQPFRRSHLQHGLGLDVDFLDRDGTARHDWSVSSRR